MMMWFFIKYCRLSARSESLLKVKNDSGFTLLEIIVAITILSFIFGVIYTSFATISESDRKIDSANEVAVKARNLMEFMMKDISSAYSAGGPASASKGEETLVYGFSGESGVTSARLDFTALSALSSHMYDRKLVEIGYYAHVQEDGAYTLFRRVDDTPDDNMMEGGYTFEVMRDLASIRFSFLKAGGEWVEEWNINGGASLPGAVRVGFSFSKSNNEGEEDFSIQFPIMSGKVL